MRKYKRAAAIILASTVLIAMAASLFVVACEANHDCAGEDCMICAILAVCQNTLKTLTDALTAFAMLLALVFCAVSLTTAFKAPAHVQTPISLKVKLLN